jgi:hypothetical protein
VVADHDQGVVEAERNGPAGEAGGSGCQRWRQWVAGTRVQSLTEERGRVAPGGGGRALRVRAVLKVTTLQFIANCCNHIPNAIESKAHHISA